MELTTEQVIRQTQHWISNVVIGCGFCPFAYKVWADKSIGYTVVNDTALHTHGVLLLQEISKMDVDPALETVLLIFPLAYEHFSAYLSFLKQCEKLMSRKGYDGVYQLASFHPDYVFEGDQEDDAANYTNRSPYPMLHLLREASIESALSRVADPDEIPQRNIRFARQKGLDYMRELLAKARQA